MCARGHPVWGTRSLTHLPLPPTHTHTRQAVCSDTPLTRAGTPSHTHTRIDLTETNAGVKEEEGERVSEGANTSLQRALSLSLSLSLFLSLSLMAWLIQSEWVLA